MTTHADVTPHFEVVSVIVADMARALAFYRRLGMDIPEGADTEPHVDVALPGGLRFSFDTEDVIRGMDPRWQRPTGGHRVGLAFRCASPAEVDRVYARLTADGYTGALPPWDAFWGQRYAVLHDPDGNPVDLFAQI